MNKNLDCQIYYEADDELADEPNRLPQRKVLHTRILKLPAERWRNSYEIIGEALFDSGQFQKSICSLKRATIVWPKNPNAQFNLAKAFFQLEKENEAFSCLQKLLCLSPSNYRVHHDVIGILQEQRRLDSLQSFYQETANMLTDQKLIPAFYFACAETLVTQNQFLQSFQMYEKAIEADSVKREYHYQYAMALYHEGLFEEAIVEFTHVKRLDPRNKLAFNNIAHIHYCLGRVQEAYKEFEDIIANGLESAGTYSNFILVLHYLDKDEEVINKYRDLLQQQFGRNGHLLWGMYQEALRITQAILEKDDIDEETREFNTKKLKGLNLVLSFLS